MTHATDELSPIQRIMEICHDLDLYRCFGRGRMVEKLANLSRDLGDDTRKANLLARKAIDLIAATGDRIMFSPFDDILPRDYQDTFNECSRPQGCFPMILSITNTAIAPGEAVEAPSPVVPGEHLTRFASSKFKALHAAQMAQWRLTKWDDEAVDKNRQEIKMQLQTMLKEWCKTRPHPDEDLEARIDRACEAFKVETEEAEKPNETVEDMAVRLWTAGGRSQLQYRELCSILNEVVRKDAHATGDTAAPDSSRLLSSAVSLICMLQHHLNAARRMGLAQPSNWPDGEHGTGENRSTTKNETYRGGGIDPSALQFYKALAGTGRVYRVPGLLATSFQRRTAIGFLPRAGVFHRVLWHVRLTDPDELGGGCQHVNFLEKTPYTSEKEFLFSAYSAFRVVSVKESTDPMNDKRPHEITIQACADNSDESEDVPSAPWY